MKTSGCSLRTRSAGNISLRLSADCSWGLLAELSERSSLTCSHPCFTRLYGQLRNCMLTRRQPHRVLPNGYSTTQTGHTRHRVTALITASFRNWLKWAWPTRPLRTHYTCSDEGKSDITS